MKKKLTPEKKYSEGFDQAIEKDKQKRPEAYKKNTFTFGSYIAERSEFNEAKKKSASVIGAKGGRNPKINKPILEALGRYLADNPKVSEMRNSEILIRFKRKIKQSPIEVVVDGQRFNISFYSDKTTGHDLIISKPCERYDGKKVNNIGKSIACSTFVTRYIPCAKKTIFNKNSK